MPLWEFYLLFMVYIKGAFTNWDIKNPETMKSIPGSCLLIPCTFNYPSDKNPTKGIIPIWYKNYVSDRKIIYHPTDKTDEAFQGRVQFLGDTTQRNCTVLIKNIKREDAGFFNFRFELMEIDKWVDARGVKVDVTDTPLEPAVVTPAKISEGDSVTFECSTPYVCPGSSITLEWQNFVAERSFLTKSVQLDTSQGLMTQTLTTSFTWQENKKTIDCAVTVDGVKAVSKIVLNVLHAPKEVKVLITSSRDVIKQGDSVTLKCQVSSSNPAIDTYTWYKNGAEHSTGGFISFHSISINDTGEFRCEAQNGVGRQTSETVRLIVFSAKVLLDPSSEVREGEKATLTCDVPGVGPEEIRYSWFKNNVQIKESSVRSLVFHGVKKDDSGDYFCKVQNDKGDDSSPAVTLIVLYAPQEVMVLITSSRDVIKQGDSVTLTCQVNSSNPAIDAYTWYKNGAGHSTGGFIYFHSISTNDTGEFRCEAQNVVGMQTSEAVRLTVFSAYTTVDPSSEVREGEKVTLTCGVPGVRPEEIRYSWFKNNVRLKESSVRSLVFHEVTVDDAGYYFCKTQNDKGDDSSPPITLNVLYPPRVPTLTSFLETQEGQLAIIQCTVDSNPESQLTLNKDGHTIASTSSQDTGYRRLKVASTWNSMELEIQEVKLSDEGTYSCFAQNSVGSSTSSLHFVVETSRVIITPDAETQEGEAATLTCLATRNSETEPTYTWYKDGKLLKDAVGENTLSFRRLSKDDAGSYYCKVRDGNGSSSAPSVNLRVLFPPGDLLLTSLMTIQGGHMGIIRCSVASDPYSELFLYKQDTLVASSTMDLHDRRNKVSTSTNSLTLEILDVHFEDEGTYQCHANNTFGRTSGSLELTADTATVNVAPSSEVREGDSVTLRCLLKSMSSKDSYLYAWYKNGALYSETREDFMEFPQVTSSHSGSYYCQARKDENRKNSSPVTLTVMYAPRDIQLKSFLETVEGKVGSIHCTVDSYTPARMYLYLENRMVASNTNKTSTNERYTVSSSRNELRLDIKNVNLKDEGKYNCTSTNSIGSASASKFFKVQNLRILVSPSGDILEGEKVTLKCDMLQTQTETVTYTWYKDSKRLQESEENSLEFEKMESGDSGYYHCKAQDAQESYLSPSVSLHVSYAPRQPVMSSFWDAQTGDIGIIHCSVDSDPPSVLALYKGKTLIGSTDSFKSSRPRMIMSSSYNSLKLEIRDVLLEDEEMYLCFANNSIGQSVSSINFTAETARILISPSAVVQEGHFVNMTCAAATESSRGITYSWYKNGKLYKESAKTEIRFELVSKDDAGSYHCTVHNQHRLKMSPSVTLNVLYAPANVFINSFLETQNGKVAIILCGVDSNPPSEMSLYKDGKLLASSAPGGISKERMLTYFSSDALRLEIPDMTSSDEGTYTFVATNIFGSDQVSTVLTVKGARVTMSPSTYITEGHLVTLTCEVMDSPQTMMGYTWYKNSRWFQDGSAGALVFSGTRSSDAGSYSCTAHTGTGSLTSPPAVLHILYQPRNLTMTSFFEMQERRLGVILCNVDSDPPSFLTLRHGADVVASSISLNPSKNMKISASHNSLKLEIYDITSETQGLYQCQANNSLGILETSIVFSVETAKIAFSPSSELNEGATVTLTCQTPRKMDKNGTYTWYKNNNWLKESTSAAIILSNVSSSDTGSYHCLAKHRSSSSISPHAALTVQYGPRKPVINSFIDTHGRQHGILVCSVSSFPPSVMSLYRGGYLLTSTASARAGQGLKYLSSSSYNYLKVEIRDVAAEDSGEYTCVANNTLGVAASSVIFTIKDGQLLAYKSVTWVAILCIVVLLASIGAILYWIRGKERYQLQTDKDSFEMSNKETSEISS